MSRRRKHPETRPHRTTQRPLVLESLEDRRLLSTTRLDNPEAIAGDVTNYRVSPDGEFGVYIADATDAGVLELHSVQFSSGTVTKLNAPLAPGGDVVRFQIAPDSSRVVYEADQDVRDVVELYSVPIAGGLPTKLNGELVEGGNIGRPSFRTGFPHFAISQDSTQVVYLADQETDEVFELFGVPLSGGSSTKLNGALTSGGDVNLGFQVSPDSSRVVYVANQDSANSFELYSAPLSGGGSTKLNDALASGGNVAADGFEIFEVFRISPDSNRVVYLADQETNDVTELFSVPLAGGGSTKVSGALTDGGDVGREGFFTGRGDFGVFRISPDSSRVVYLADQLVDGKFELFSGPILGGEVVKLNGDLTSFGTVKAGFEVSPDSARVVYRADQESLGVNELYSVPLAGGDETRLNGDLVTGGSVDFTAPFLLDEPLFTIAPDSSRVIYLADQETEGVQELFSTPLTGGDSVKLNGELPEGGEVDFRVRGISPSSSTVVYRADQNAVRFPELFSVPIAGGATTQLTPAGAVADFEFLPNGTQVVYRASPDTPGVSELFRVSTNGENASKVSGPITAIGGAVTHSQLTPDGQFAVYRADHEVEGVFELFRVSIATGERTKLTDGFSKGGSISNSFQLSPDGLHAVYEIDPPGIAGIYSVPVAGGSETMLNDVLVDGGRILDFSIAPDSSRVVFRAEEDTLDVFELYSAPISGGGSTKLNNQLATGGDVQQASISPDSTRVVYRADEVNDVFELFSVPIAGGEVTTLNGDLVDGGDVDFRFQISPDSSRVVYVADEEADFAEEIYSVPITGGTAVNISGGEGVNFEISPDSTRVVFQSDRDIGGVQELYSVDIAGGEATKLNPSLGGGRDVNSQFDISPDGSRVVYRADQERNGIDELFSVPILGGESVKLNPTLVDNGDVRPTFFISPDGSRVVYRADQETNDVNELFSVPIAGGDAIKLNDPLVEGGNVSSDFAFSPDSQTIVFLADQEVDEVQELFFTPATGGGVTKINDPLVEGGDVSDTGLPDPFGLTSHGFEISPNSARVIYVADQDVNDQPGLYTAALGETPTLQVTSLEANESGFSVTFNATLDTSTLNLYSTLAGQQGAADVTLEGAASGPVRGSFVVDPSGTRATFIRTGGPLVPDDYTVRLMSGESGVLSASVGQLDGDADGTPGDRFETTFRVLAVEPPPTIVSLPDFVRGPGQEVDLPADSNAGIPVSISNGAAVRTATLRIGYDPALLNVVAATPGANLPAGATVDLDTSTAGVAVLTVASPSDLPAGESVLAHLEATVVATDASEIYRRQQVLDLHEVVLADGAGQPLPSSADDGLHLVTFFGDVSGNGRINAADAAQVARIAALIDGGFAATLLTDPNIPGDISGNGRLNAADAALVARFSALLPVPQIPPIPGGVFVQGALRVPAAPAELTGWQSVELGEAEEEARIADREAGIDASLIDEEWLNNLLEIGGEFEWSV